MRKDPRYDPRAQFSKWLAKSMSIFWFAYLLILAAIIAYQPDTATAIIYLVLTVSVVMIFHVWAYTRNSTYEKGLRAMLDKTKMELSLRAGDGAGSSRDESEEEDEGEGGNG